MPIDLENIPTNDLIQAVRRNRVETLVGRSGCLLCILLLVGIGYAGDRVIAAVAPIVARTVSPWVSLGCLLGIGAALIFFLFTRLGEATVPEFFGTLFRFPKRLADYRFRHQARELDRRFGRLPIREYVRQVEEQPRPGTILCVYKSVGCLFGEEIWCCIELNEPRTPATSRTAFTFWSIDRQSDPWKRIHFVEDDVPEATVSELRRLIANAQKPRKRRSSAGPEISISADGSSELAVVFGDGIEALEIRDEYPMPHEQKSDQAILLYFVGSAFCGRKRIERWRAAAEASSKKPAL
jgi:hypothetical protein